MTFILITITIGLLSLLVALTYCERLISHLKSEIVRLDRDLYNLKVKVSELSQCPSVMPSKRYTELEREEPTIDGGQAK